MTRPVQPEELARLLAEHGRRISNLERKRPKIGDLVLPDVETGGPNAYAVLQGDAAGTDSNPETIIFFDYQFFGDAEFEEGSGSNTSLRVLSDGLYLIRFQLGVTADNTALTSVSLDVSGDLPITQTCALGVTGDTFTMISDWAWFLTGNQWGPFLVTPIGDDWHATLNLNAIRVGPVSIA